MCFQGPPNSATQGSAPDPGRRVREMALEAMPGRERVRHRWDTYTAKVQAQLEAEASRTDLSNQKLFVITRGLPFLGCEMETTATFPIHPFSLPPAALTPHITALLSTPGLKTPPLSLMFPSSYSFPVSLPCHFCIMKPQRANVERQAFLGFQGGERPAGRGKAGNTHA